MSTHNMFSWRCKNHIDLIPVLYRAVDYLQCMFFFLSKNECKTYVSVYLESSVHIIHVDVLFSCISNIMLLAYL